jgi:hypothetical protein
MPYLDHLLLLFLFLLSPPFLSFLSLFLSYPTLFFHCCFIFSFPPRAQTTIAIAIIRRSLKIYEEATRKQLFCCFAFICEAALVALDPWWFSQAVV